MAKELKNFRFFPSKWQNGDLGVESYAHKGLFIDICGFYWSKNCSVDKATLEKRFRDAQELLNDLFSYGIIKIDDSENIVINFLDEQKKGGGHSLCDCKDFAIKGRVFVCKKCGKEHKSLNADVYKQAEQTAKDLRVGSIIEIPVNFNEDRIDELTKVKIVRCTDKYLWFGYNNLQRMGRNTFDKMVKSFNYRIVSI